MGAFGAFLIVVGILAIPIVIGGLIAMLTGQCGWIFVFMVIEWLVYTIYSCTHNPPKRTPINPKDIDAYTNEYGEIKWWHED